MPSCNTYHLTWVSLNLGCGVSLHSCSSKAQPLLLTLDEGYLLTAALPDLQCGIAPLGPPAPAQPRLRVTPFVAAPDLRRGLLLPAAAPDLGLGAILTFVIYFVLTLTDHTSWYLSRNKY